MHVSCSARLNERLCHRFLFQGRELPERVHGREDHHDEDGHQELLNVDTLLRGGGGGRGGLSTASCQSTTSTTFKTSSYSLHLVPPSTGPSSQSSPIRLSPGLNHWTPTTPHPFILHTSSTNSTKALTETMREAALTASSSNNAASGLDSLDPSPDAGRSETRSLHLR